LVREGESTDRGKIPSIRFNINRTEGTAGFYFAEVAVTELRCKVSVDLIATKNFVGGVFVIARDPGASHTCAAVLRLRLADTAAEVPAGLAARLRHARGRSCHYGGAQHCCQKNLLVPSHCVAPFVFVLMENPARTAGSKTSGIDRKTTSRGSTRRKSVHICPRLWCRRYSVPRWKLS